MGKTGGLMFLALHFSPFKEILSSPCLNCHDFNAFFLIHMDKYKF